MASPLRASTSRPTSPLGSTSMQTQNQAQGHLVSSPSGFVFADPFPSPSPEAGRQAATPADATTISTIPPLTRVDDDNQQRKTPQISTVHARDTFAPIEHPAPTPLLEVRSELPSEDSEVWSDRTDSGESLSDNDSIKSTEGLKAEEIRYSRLSNHQPDNSVHHDHEALTDAERELTSTQPEVLVPGPRGIFDSSGVREGYVTHADFSKANVGPVPRVEVTSGAIQNTQGEVVPIEDEDIHLAAGETLIDGTGRVWNAKGMIEPGRDERGEAILYQVDIAQIRRANNGELPAIMPWDDARWGSDGVRTPSFSPSDDVESDTPFSDIFYHSELETPVGAARRDSDSDYLYQIDREMDPSGPDDALDDVERREAEEEREAVEADEERIARAHRTIEERRRR
ncbi:hypothetical protein NliqN6_0001 [Naganishia liquefaciens]|uniref:Uncharacterized protein n=1 Tax=Naganishia liquefaciens TaxID=104408 RepID=A0A8H3TNU0_9TREE|nr:hypothetical protein NliqN6_0001 [Naganishia liquefaciens]